MTTNPFLENVLLGLQSDLLRAMELAWIRQLETEYEQICFQYRLKLQRPVFSLMDSDQTWGTWNPQSRGISINRTLIHTHPWKTVVAVLKHEMAHQVVEEIALSSGHHDGIFRDVCEQMGLEPQFRRARISLTDPIFDWKNQPPAPEEERILRKAERLLALAGSQNEHEATTAMERVREILNRHSIDLERTQRKGNHVALTLETGRKRIDRISSGIAGILNDFYGVKIIHASLYNAHHQESFKTIEVLGLKENVLMAEYVFHFLTRTVDNLWKTHLAQQSSTSQEKNSYQTGLLTGLRRKLDRAQQRSNETQPKEETGLVAASERKLDAFVKSQFPRLSTKQTSSRNLHGNAYKKGCDEGERIVIHKGVEEQRGKTGRLLPAAK